MVLCTLTYKHKHAQTGNPQVRPNHIPKVKLVLLAFLVVWNVLLPSGTILTMLSVTADLTNE